MSAAAGDAQDNVGLADIGGAGADDSGEAATSEVKPWSARIQKAIKRSRAIRGGNYVQIATVDGEGLPHCRTVVFRGFLPVKERGGREAMRMITDARSEKVQHASHSPACQMVWWFSQSSEQFRISGQLQFVGPKDEGELQAARQAAWSELRDTAREQFWWDTPGIPYSGEPSPPKGGRGADGEVMPPPDYFLLMLLWPQQVKYLRLTDNYSQLDTADRETGQWAAARVNP